MSAVRGGGGAGGGHVAGLRILEENLTGKREEFGWRWGRGIPFIQRLDNGRCSSKQPYLNILTGFFALLFI